MPAFKAFVLILVFIFGLLCFETCFSQDIFQNVAANILWKIGSFIFFTTKFILLEIIFIIKEIFFVVGGQIFIFLLRIPLSLFKFSVNIAASIPSVAYLFVEIIETLWMIFVFLSSDTGKIILLIIAGSGMIYFTAIHQKKVCCVVCLEEIENYRFESCGNLKCSGHICNTCKKYLIGELVPGKLVLIRNLVCAACQILPKREILIKYNVLLSNLENLNRDICKLISESKYYFGWCIECNNIKEFILRECSNNKIPEISNFKCDICSEKIQTINELKTYKRCPKCQIHTVKSGGCNHITCRCGTHWCYKCAKEFKESDIYNHMDNEHGGYYDEGEDPDDDDEEYYEEDEDYDDDDDDDDSSC